MSAYDDLEIAGDELETFGENEYEENDNVNQEAQAPAEGNEGDGEGEAASKPVKPKRVVRNPQPKLDAERLKGPRGLTALESHFDRVKYKGPGYEEQDLNVILKTYEYWCHRLFPKFPFDECIAKIEHLGSKKAVVTHIKRMRYDLLCEDIPLINNDNNNSDAEVEPENLFDNILSDLPNEEQSVELSEEQLEQIRLNKEKAERKRQERLNRTLNASQNFENNVPSQDDFPSEDENEGHISPVITKFKNTNRGDDFPSDEDVASTSSWYKSRRNRILYDEDEETGDCLPSQNNISGSQDQNMENFSTASAKSRILTDGNKESEDNFPTEDQNKPSSSRFLKVGEGDIEDNLPSQANYSSEEDDEDFTHVASQSRSNRRNRILSDDEEVNANHLSSQDSIPSVQNQDEGISSSVSSPRSTKTSLLVNELETGNNTKSHDPDEDRQTDPANSPSILMGDTVRTGNLSSQTDILPTQDENKENLLPMLTISPRSRKFKSLMDDGQDEIDIANDSDGSTSIDIEEETKRRQQTNKPTNGIPLQPDQNQTVEDMDADKKSCITK